MSRIGCNGNLGFRDAAKRIGADGVDHVCQAAQVVSSTLQAIIAKTKTGANIIELCEEGDKLIEQGTAALYNKTKGLAKGV